MRHTDATRDKNNIYIIRKKTSSTLVSKKIIVEIKVFLKHINESNIQDPKIMQKNHLKNSKYQNDMTKIQQYIIIIIHDPKDLKNKSGSNTCYLVFSVVLHCLIEISKDSKPINGFLV